MFRRVRRARWSPLLLQRRRMPRTASRWSRRSASSATCSPMSAAIISHIKTIVGAGGDCELYQPTAADVATVASARAVFLNDLNEEFEPWLEPLLKQAAFKGTKVVVSRGVRTLTAEEEHPVSGRQLPAAIDQHAWLDPRNGVIYVRNIAEALARLDPANAADYRARAAAYTKEIQAVDDWARKEMAGVPAGQAAGAGVARFAAVHRQCLRHHVADGERLDQQERALGGGAGEAGAADPGRTREGAVPRQHHRSAGDAAHRRRNRCGDRRHALRRFALPAPAARRTATSRCCATTWPR